MTEMSSIVTALGAGSGVDMAALATNLAQAQFALRSERLTAKTELLTSQISAASTIKNMLSSLSSALADRVRTGDLSPQPVVASAAVATASSPAGTTGSGTYSLEVLSLASSQTLASPPFASGTAVVGSGTLTLRFGTATGSSFLADSSRSAVDIEIKSGATLADIAGAINAKKVGVTAYVAQTDNGSQLVFKGADGVQNGFVIEATEASGDPGLAALAWNPTSGGDPARLTKSAANASFKLDGLLMSSASNNTGTIATGLSLQLTGTNAGNPTQIGFSSPASNITSAMQDLVGALNEVVGELNSATNPSSGDLSSDPGARALKQLLSKLAGQVVMPGAAGTAPRTLSDLGLAIQRDGTFRLDETKLATTIARDPAGTAAMFTNGLYGVYSTFDKLARSATSTGDPGSLGGSIARYQSMSKKVTEESSKLAEKQEALRASMVARFAKADTRISASQSTLSFLQAQIDAWNSSRD